MSNLHDTQEKKTTLIPTPDPLEVPVKLLLDSAHRSLGAKMGEFAGHEMPLYYTGPIEEHHQVRNNAGIFDISHMGQMKAEGERVVEGLQHALVSDVTKVKEGQSLYSLMCREDGGILDDLIIYKESDSKFFIIVNGACRDSDRTWLTEVLGGFGVKFTDVSDNHCLFAIQGPKVLALLDEHCTNNLLDIPFQHFVHTSLFDVPVFLTRTGYTGESGCEVSVAAEHAHHLWEQVTTKLNIPPIGLAARDTLRLEASLALYGHELREDWHPLECGMGWLVHDQIEGDFIGKRAIQALKATKQYDRQVCLMGESRAIPRGGYKVYYQSKFVGVITSGTFSPTLQKPISMAKVRYIAAKIGNKVEVDIRGKRLPFEVVKRPFIRKEK